MTALEIVKTDREEKTRERGLPSGSFGVFVGSVLAVVALAFMLALGFFVADVREKNLLLDLKVQTLSKEVAYLRGQIDAQSSKENRP